MDFKFGQYIHRVYPNKRSLKILEKRECGCIQGLPKVLKYPLLSQERVKLRTSNLAGTFTGSIQTKLRPLKILEKSERGPARAVQSFKVPPIISGTGKATDFKFGRCIHRVHPKKSPFKILEKMERRAYPGPPGTAESFKYSLLSKERVNLRTSNLAGTFTWSIRTKAH